ncbi:hypothetical protein [Eubacterium xylanophilum]|nr:hypothetical protein [Eubacterium xylanophilum]
MRVKKICATFLSIGVLAGAIGSCPSISQAFHSWKRKWQFYN